MPRTSLLVKGQMPITQAILHNIFVKTVEFKMAAEPVKRNN